MRVVFRVDSSSRIASGHVMRCLSLAQYLRAKGMDVLFISRELSGNIINLIATKNFTVYLLPWSEMDLQFADQHSKYGIWLEVNLIKEIEETTSCLKQIGKIDWLIVDHYALDEQWEKAMKSYSKRLMVIDDLANRKHDCDLLLDQNYYSDMQERYLKLIPPTCQLFLGPKYALLRQEFIRAREKVKIREGIVQRILVFLGGADPNNITKKVLDTLIGIDFNGIIDVIVGKQNQYKVEIKNICETNQNYNFYCQIDNIADLMIKADLAIGAGGSTTWERCCLGLPSIVICTGDNEKELIRHANSVGIIYAISEINFDDINNTCLINSLNFFLTQPKILTDMSNCCFEFVDGLGCARMFEALM